MPLPPDDPPPEPLEDPPLDPPPVAPLPPVLDPPLEPPIELPDPPLLLPPMAPLEPLELLPDVVSRLLPETPAAPLERLERRLEWVVVVLVSEDDEGCPADESYPPLLEPDEPPYVDEPVEPPLVCANAPPANDKAPSRSKVIEDLLCFMIVLLRTAMKRGLPATSSLGLQRHRRSTLAAALPLCCRTRRSLASDESDKPLDGSFRCPVP